MTSEDSTARLRALGSHAAKAGYRLVLDPALPETWSLVDADDGEIILPAATLDGIRQWLDE